jgi:SAM-dependent methyltransferase
MQHIEGTLGPDGFCDTPRVARRWRAVLWALGAAGNCTLPLKDKSFLDLGCFQGDFCALAAAEGMHAFGVDQGGFRTGENSIEIARQLWDGFPFGELTLTQHNITEWPSYVADVVMMFSTWSYIVKDHGLARAEEVLAKVIAEAGVLFFENQLYGDGPGPEFLKIDEDIRTTLHRLGGSTVKALATFPVTGRPGSRTVWEVHG